jgi:hypothetical protein
MVKSLATLCGALVLWGASVAGAAEIRGDYIEARNADVYTGPCFSNAEVLIYGDQAILAWKVTDGSFDGVDLSGLGVAAAIKGTTTFSEDRPGEARSVLIVDQKATPRQREALVALAKALAGDRLAHVEAVKTSLISMMIEEHARDDSTSSRQAEHRMPHAPYASFWAPGMAEIATRPLDEGDHFCGNEVVAYAPLSKGVDVLPAYTLGHQYRGKELHVTWDDPNCRSSFVGHFSY